MKHFYTDGKITIKLDEEDQVPEGFRPGRTFKANPWNRGLTKDDPRVAENAAKTKATRHYKNNYKSWNTGLTKENSVSLQRVSKKVSKARKGKPSWNKGKHWSDEWKATKSQQMQEIAESRTNEFWKSVTEKITTTKHLHNSFVYSGPEEQFYAKLLQQYGAEDVIRQYKDPRYPFNCDFYVKSKDLFIELNYHWSHGKHPYDASSESDKKREARLREKAKSSKAYASTLKIWTQVDPAKLNILRANHLNFMIIYPKNIILTA